MEAGQTSHPIAVFRPGPASRRMPETVSVASWARIAREYMFNAMKSNRVVMDSMSPGRMSIRARAASWSRYASG